MKALRGFTLVELLVVISIIGILSAVVLTSLNSARQKGRDARRISDIKQIQLALELYYDSTGSYPSAIGPAGAGSPLVSNGYMATLPTDPSNNALYSYVPYKSTLNNTNLCIGYHIGASLESGSTHSALQNDADTTSVPANLDECVNGGTDFSGADVANPCSPGDVGSACFDARS